MHSVLVQAESFWYGEVVWDFQKFLTTEIAFVSSILQFLLDLVLWDLIDQFYTKLRWIPLNGKFTRSTEVHSSLLSNFSFIVNVRPQLEEYVVPFTKINKLNLGHRKISLVTRRPQCIHPGPSHLVLSEKDCCREQRYRQRMPLSFQMSEKSETTFS